MAAPGGPVGTQWRMAAIIAGLGWVVSSIALIVLSLTTTAPGRYWTWAFPIALVAGVPVLALLRFLGAAIAGNPPARESSLRIAFWLSVVLLVVAWSAYLV